MPGNASKSDAEKRLAQRGIAPRLLLVEVAAAYCGLGVDAFLAGVETGQLPRPLRFGRRQLWDRHKLDAALDGLSGMHLHSERGTPADEITAAIECAYPTDASRNTSSASASKARSTCTSGARASSRDTGSRARIRPSSKPS